MLHLYDFARIDLPSLDLLGRLKADETKAVAETFATNLRRVISLLHITPALVSVSAESLMAAEQAGEGAADGVGRMARVLAGQPLPSDVAERLFGRMRELAGADAATRKRNEYIAFHHAQLCLQLLGQFGHDYVPALLYSATVQTWSAFEVFCKDLWASLVNVRPKWAVGEYPDREPKQGGSEHGDKRQYSTLPFDVLSQFNFDLSRSFGSAMCEARKVAFDKPNDISESYASIFGKKNFSPVFDLYIGRLKCLCLLRNLIIHRGGRVDHRFLCDIEDARFRAASPGQAIQVQSPVVVEHLQLVADAGCAILSHVDDALHKHSECLGWTI